MFHTIFGFFSTKNGKKKHKTIRNPGPPPPPIFVCFGPVYVIHKGICFVWRLFGGSRVASIIKSYQISEEKNVTMNEAKETYIACLMTKTLDWYAPGIFHFLIGQWRRDANRLEICPDRRDRRSCKIFSAV